MTDENPYQSPASADEPPLISTEERKRAVSAVRLPAMIILTLGVIAILLDIAGICNLIYILLDLKPGMKALAQAFRFMIIINLALLAVHAFTIYGAHRMLNLRAIWLARAAMIVCLVPYFTPLFLLGIPFGIWGLVVLFRPSVTAEFGK